MYHSIVLKKCDHISCLVDVIVYTYYFTDVYIGLYFPHFVAMTRSIKFDEATLTQCKDYRLIQGFTFVCIFVLRSLDQIVKHNLITGSNLK
jgi:hypothetical protein